MVAEEWEDDSATVGVMQVKVTPICFSVNIYHTYNLFIKTKVNGHACKAMIDSGATHNFISPECAKRFGLVTQPLLNLSISFVQGSTKASFLAKNISIEADAWKGSITFLVVPMKGLGSFWDSNGLINISFHILARKWTRYYWITSMDREE